ncbi:hypothetical protein BDW74DRAFT_182213 [Aspergillus multicolor]|uniref:uncharacterized protein n=1 Tax=Aspergillus multicolor TaxID=41759 RepID=UPI003CCD1B13
MKLEALAALAALVTLGTAQSTQLADYRALCSADQDTGTKTFDNGLTAEYTCRVKASSAVEPTEESASSSEECAAKCDADPACASAMWQYTRDRCVLYGADSDVTLSPHARGSVYLQPAGSVPVDDGQGEGEDSAQAEDLPSNCHHERQACEDELEHQRGITETCEEEKSELQAERDELEHHKTLAETCQAEKATLQADRNQCQAGQSSLNTRLTTCQRDKNTLDSNYKRQVQQLQSQLDQCRKAVIPLASASCPASTQATASYSGLSWRIICQKTVPGSDKSGTHRGTNSRDQCVQHCAQEAACKWSHWHAGTRGCWTYRSSWKPEQFNVQSSWDVYLKL